MAKPSTDATLVAGNSLSTGIVGCWPLLEGTGSTSADKSAGGRTATINHPTWQTVDGDPVLRGTSNSQASPVTLSSTLTLPSSGDWTIAWRAVQSTDNNSGIICGLAASATLENLLAMLGSSNLLRIYFDDATNVQRSRNLFTTLADYAIVVDNTALTVKMYVDGVQLGADLTIADAKSFEFDSLAGGEATASNWALVGDLHYLYAWAGRKLSDAEVLDLATDPYQIVAVQTDSLTVTGPNRVWQRSSTSASVSLSGGYFHASADHVQARILLESDESVIVDWTTVDASLADQTWSGSITVPMGGPYLVECRLRDASNNVLLSADGAESILVGDVFINIGQSNAGGFYDNYQTYSGTAESWCIRHDQSLTESLTDPTGRATDYGSYLPVLATLLDAFLEGEVPLIFLTCCESSTSLAVRWLPPGGVNWVEADAVVDTAYLNGCKGVLWFQGETDALNGVSQESYKANEVTLASYVDDWPGTPKMISTIIGNFAGSTTDANLDTVRAAKIANWTDGTTLVGPMTYDMDFVGPHIQTDAQCVQYSGRLLQCIKHHCYGEGSPYRGPRIESASVTGSVVTVTFDSDLNTADTTYTSAAWTVDNDDGTARTVSSVERTGTRTVDVTCSGNVDGTAPTITFGSGNTADAATVPRTTNITLPATIHSISTITLPAEPFLAYPISSASSITITSPVSSDRRIVGIAEAITWTSLNVSGTVDILISTNNGSSFSSLADAETNDGTYSWTPTAGQIGSQVIIRIRQTSDVNVFDDSDAFIVASTAGGGYIIGS